jgi:hypothetical protein
LDRKTPGEKLAAIFITLDEKREQQLRRAGSASEGGLKRGLMSENSTHTQSHIDSIAKQEHEFLEQRTLTERVSDRVAGFAGSMFFVLFHILLVVFWVLINANRVSWIPRFDPYPFSLLGMIVAVEAVLYTHASESDGKTGRAARPLEFTSRFDSRKRGHETLADGPGDL